MGRISAAASRVMRVVRGALWSAGIHRQRHGDSFRAHDQHYRRANALEGESARGDIMLEMGFAHPELRLDELLARHPEVRDLAVDVGSGTGWLSALLAEQFRRVVAIEPSRKASGIGKKLYAARRNIDWRIGFAKEHLARLQPSAPTLFVTGAVLSHMTDDEAADICALIDKKAPRGSLLCLAECWGPEAHERLWHVRSKDWWRARFPGWRLEFHGPGGIQSIAERHKGIHGVKQ